MAALQTGRFLCLDQKFPVKSITSLSAIYPLPFTFNLSRTPETFWKYRV